MLAVYSAMSRIEYHPPVAPVSAAGRFRQWFLGRPRVRAQQFDALDGLRGLAFLIVLASHMSWAGLLPLPGQGLIGVGKSGVYLFFVLSAFLLTRALIARPPAALVDRGLWANYVLRRVLRIWPLYLVVLLLSWGLTAAGVERWSYPLDTAALLRHLTLREGQGVLWSIPVEFKFYLVLPLLAVALAWTRARRWPLLGEAALLVAVLACASWVWPPDQAGRNDVRLGPYLVVFVCGCFAARLDLRLRERSRAGSPLLWGLAGLVAVLGWVVSIPEVWAAITGTAVDRRVSHHWFVFFGLVWSCLLLAVLHGPGWLRAVFSSAPVRLVGVVSFSAYLWHMPVLAALRRAGAADWPLAPLLTLLAVLLVAMVSFLLFERPWRDLALARRSRPAAASSEAEVAAAGHAMQEQSRA